MDPMLMTCPRSRATIPGNTARVTQSSPFTLVSSISSQSLGKPAGKRSRPRLRPALLTRMSISCHAAGNAETACSTATRSRTSSSMTRASAPWAARISAESCASRSPRRAARTRRPPSRAKTRAQACPMPELAPVIMTVAGDGMRSSSRESTGPAAGPGWRAGLNTRIRDKFAMTFP